MTGFASDLRVVPAAVLAWAGTALFIRVDAVWAIVAGLVLLTAATACWKRRSLAFAAVLLSLVFLGCGLRIVAVTSSPIAALAEQESLVLAEVTLRQDARAFTGPNGPGSVWEVTIKQLQSKENHWRTRHRASAFLAGAQPELLAGQSLLVRAKLAQAQQFDDVAQLRILAWRELEVTPWWWRASARVRDGIAGGVDHRTNQGAALVPALVAGDDSRLSEQTDSQFQRTGLTHLLAVSGANLTIVLAVVLFGLRARSAGPRLILAAGALTVVAFVLVARPEPSVQRAAVMGSVALVGLLVGSTSAGLRALAWAILALLLFDPWLAGQPGFILSVCATAGIIAISPVLAARLNWLPATLAQAVAVPLAAHLACLPAIAFLSGEVSLVAVAANMVASPAVAPATVLGLAAGLLDLLCPPLAAVVGEFAVWAGSWIVAVARFCAGLGGASIGWSLPWWTLILITPIVAVAIWAAASRPAVFLGLCLALAIALVRPPSPGWPPRNLLVAACDVGQGDGFVVPVAPGAAIVVDVGPDPVAIDKCLQQLRIDHIALLVFTHAHADHMDGAVGATGGRQVDLVAVGPSGGPRVAGAERVTLQLGQELSVGRARVEVLWPAAGPKPPSQDQFNDASLVLRITVGQRRLLFLGDLGQEAQRQLANSGTDLHADVLKVAHHGSADQWPELLDRVRPSVGLIGVGAKNTHGHPTRSLLASLEEHSVATLRTDLHGDIAVVERDGRLRASVR